MQGGPAHHTPTWVVTKLRPPELRDAIRARPRLTAVFDEALDSGDTIVLVSAPAGSGKSTAIASWSATQRGRAVTWMQIDDGDSDPVRFWSALAIGLAEHHPRVASEVIPLMQTPRVGFAEAVVPAFVNALDGDGPTVIVLDDYHLVTNADIHDQIAALVDARPDDLMLVVSTRIDPPLRLGRLRVRGQLREIRAADLRFDAHEAAPFFAATDVTTDDIDVLCERTEGWAAGLVLAAVSLARTTDPRAFVENFAGDNRMVVDYLTSELWDTLPAQVREFFMELSILDKMCGSLVDALMETEGRGAGWLETASHDNQLVIPLDDHGGWYRFHHLLQDLLRSRLDRERPARVSVLHERAARWFADHGDETAAIEHALAADDIGLAVELIGAHGSNIFSEGRLVTVQRWLDDIGENTVRTNPSLAVLRVWTMLIDGDWPAIDDPISTARQLLEEGDVDDPTTRLLKGSVHAASAITQIARGDIGAASETIRTVVASPDTFEITPLVRGIDGICLTWSGSYREAKIPLQRSADDAPKEGEHLIAATSLLFLGIVAFAEDDLGRARHFAQAALDHAALHGLTEYHQLALAHSLLGRTLEADAAELALHCGRRGISIARRSHETVMLAYALVMGAQIIMSHGADDGVDDDAGLLLTEARKLLDDCSNPGIVLTMLARTEARIGTTAALSHDPDMVETLTDRELTVLRLLPSSLSVREIADELYVSQNTVKGHIKAVYRKLGVNERAVAVQRARELQLL